MVTRKDSRKTGRVRFNQPLKVIIRSIGAEATYDLETRNISYTGFFLDFEKPGRFPFTNASIMEIWITLESDLTIFFNGKMTRKVFPTDSAALDTGPGIAVRIIQIDSKNERLLSEFIDRMQKDKHNNSAA